MAFALVYRKRYAMAEVKPKLAVAFYRSKAGVEPVRAWLRGLPKSERQTIGREIRTLQFGWPLGMPLVRKIEQGLWELRVDLDKRTARVIFTVIDNSAVLIHGFIKKSRKIPGSDLALLRRRARSLNP